MASINMRCPTSPSVTHCSGCTGHFRRAHLAASFFTLVQGGPLWANMTIPTALSSSNDPTPDSPRSIASTDSNAPLPSFVELAPPRPGLTKPSEEAVIEIPGLDVGVRLKVDAGNGCGGIAWPAGEVSDLQL